MLPLAPPGPASPPGPPGITPDAPPGPASPAGPPGIAPDAPPGPYQLEIGFYSEADFARSPVTDAQGNPIGDHFVFEEMRVQ